MFLQGSEKADVNYKNHLKTILSEKYNLDDSSSDDEFKEFSEIDDSGYEASAQCEQDEENEVEKSEHVDEEVELTEEEEVEGDEEDEGEEIEKEDEKEQEEELRTLLQQNKAEVERGKAVVNQIGMLLFK